MRRLKLAHSVLFIVVLACGACRPPAAAEVDTLTSAPDPALRQGGVLRISMLTTASRVLHPYPQPQHQTTPRRNAATLMYANLIDVDWDRLDFVADPRRSMAKELPAISADGRAYTFTLRADVKWSDGRPITAEDFVYAFEQASQKENGYVGLSDLEYIESFKAASPTTMVVTLTQPLARPLALTIFEDKIHPVPRHVWEGKPWYDPDGNPEILQPTVVSGPFVLKESTAEQQAFVRNPNWWGKQPLLDQIVMVSATPATIVELLRTKQVEWAEAVPPPQYADLKKVSDINVVEMSGAVAGYRVMQFNLRRPLLADRRVREALARVIQREDLIQYEDDLATPQFGPYTPANTRWVHPDIEKYAYDPARARRLLDEAGLRLDGEVLRDPSGQPTQLEILWPTSSQPRGKIAAYLQQQWKQLGIEATVTAMEFSSFVDRYQRQHDFDVAMGTYTTPTFDADAPKTQLITTGTQNAVGYSNARVDELFELGAVEQDERRRKAIYDEIQRIVVEDLPIYYMLSTKEPTALDRRVGGVIPLKGGHLLRQNNLQVLDWYLTE